MKKPLKLLLLLTSITLFNACSDDPNKVAPTIADDKLTFTDSTGLSLKVNWEKATDDVTPSDKLQYKVVISKSNNISTVAKAEENSIDTSLTYRTDVSSQQIDVQVNVVYYVSVIVKDEDGNKALYKVTKIEPVDEVSPLIADATVTLSGETATTVDVAWAKSVDAVDTQNNLKYRVVYSTANNISTLADAEANGTTGMAYTPNIDSATVTGLTTGTTYYFNVIVKDLSGNKAIYTATSTTTM